MEKVQLQGFMWEVEMKVREEGVVKKEKLLVLLEARKGLKALKKVKP